MDEPIAVALKFAVLALVYLFVFWVARSSLRDLSGARGMVIDPVLASDDHAPIDLRSGVRPRLAVIAAHGYETGSEFDLTGGAMLGRTAPAEIIVEDPFASSRHARIFARGPYTFIEDLGSTNGTVLNGRPLQAPQQLATGDRIAIGDTEFEYRE